MATTPRGLRNNNPLNIRKSDIRWQHKITPSKDPAFEQFDKIEWGIRAGFVLLRTYINEYGLTNVGMVIGRWAPAEDGNDTANYISRVCLLSHISIMDYLHFYNRTQMIDLLWAMAYVECGKPLLRDLFEVAYDMV